MPDSVLQGYPEPSGRAVAKEMDHIDRHAKAFIELSPFLVLSCATGDGEPDLTPRGGFPGFVRVLDENRLALPDRMGNNRIDTLRKIEGNPKVALLFFVPGIDESLRVYGDTEIRPADALDVDLGERGRAPRSVLLIRVRLAFFHCAKAAMRAALWQPETVVERDAFPTIGQVLRDQIGSPPEDQRDMVARYTAIL